MRRSEMWGPHVIHLSYTIFGLMKNKEGRRIKGENGGEK